MASQKVNHPYYPRDLKIPNYVPNDIPVVFMLEVFFGFFAVLIIATWIFSGRKNHLKRKFFTRAKICWFVTCAIIHGFVEGYFAVKYDTLVEESSFMSQLWKEYGNADSRYVIGDTFAVCVETITAFIDGPLAALAAYGFLANHPSRHISQLLLSLFQLYGTILYFTTELKDGFIHSKMYHPLYFWFYFVFLNGFWLIIPTCCIAESCLALYNVQVTADSNVNVKKSKKK